MHLIGFMRSVVDEMKKVVWPNAQQTRRDTSTVVGLSVMFSIFFAIVDSIIQYLLGLL